MYMLQLEKICYLSFANCVLYCGALNPFYFVPHIETTNVSVINRSSSYIYIQIIQQYCYVLSNFVL